MFHFIIMLLCDALAGWIAGKIMDMNGSFLRNIVVGLLGGMIGGGLFKAIGLAGDMWYFGTLTSVVGACILLFACKKLFKWK